MHVYRGNSIQGPTTAGARIRNPPAARRKRYARITNGFARARAKRSRCSGGAQEAEGGGRGERFRTDGRTVRDRAAESSQGLACAIAIVTVPPCSHGGERVEAGGKAFNLLARRSRSCPRASAMIIIMRCPTPAIFEGRPAPLLPHWGDQWKRGEGGREGVAAGRRGGEERRGMHLY
jgi:hypothetical protein